MDNPRRYRVDLQPKPDMPPAIGTALRLLHKAVRHSYGEDMEIVYIFVGPAPISGATQLLLGGSIPSANMAVPLSIALDQSRNS